MINMELVDWLQKHKGNGVYISQDGDELECSKCFKTFNLCCLEACYLHMNDLAKKEDNKIVLKIKIYYKDGSTVEFLEDKPFELSLGGRFIYNDGTFYSLEDVVKITSDVVK